MGRYTLSKYNEILRLDGRSTGYYVHQDAHRTRVRPEYGMACKPELILPSNRYALSTDNTDSGVPGRSKFFSDFEQAYYSSF